MFKSHFALIGKSISVLTRLTLLINLITKFGPTEKRMAKLDKLTMETELYKSLLMMSTADLRAYSKAQTKE